MAQIKNMGSLSDLAGMLPGVKASDLEGANMDDGMLKQMEAIILSMTPYERENPGCLNSNRKKRIAAGSGTQVVDVNRLLKQFEMLQTITKQFSGGKLPRNMRKLMGKKGRLPRYGRRNARPALLTFPVGEAWYTLSIYETNSLEVNINGQNQTAPYGRQEGSLLPHRGG